MALQGCAGTFGIFSCSWVNSYNVLSIAGFFLPLLRNSNSRRFLPQPSVSADMEINISIVAHSYPILVTPLLQGPSSCPWKTVMCTGEVCKKRYGVTVLDFFLMYFIKYNSDWLNDWGITRVKVGFHPVLFVSPPSIFHGPLLVSTVAKDHVE